MTSLKTRLRDPKLWRASGAVLCLVLLGLAVAFPRLVLPVLALLCGSLFFLYGLKSYASIAVIMLSTSGANGNGNGNGNAHDGSRKGLVNRLRKGNSHHPNGGHGNGKPLKLPADKQPFISIQLPMYNEDRVVDRLLSACTQLDYENYEVLVADDSSDQTLHTLERWAKHPKVRVSHRINRSGFKGAALKHASEVMNPKAKFVAVFDADFIPPPDILHQFLSYFYGVGSSNGDELNLIDESLAVVQGYQWHVLNASENWITRAIRAEFAGSYVIERSTQELTGGMKMISGSVFMIRADVLRQHKWGTSITEDWELTLRLYLDGYKVLYTPFIQAPAECVSDFKQLTRQRMRWAEGHTFNVKRFFLPVMGSSKLSLREKLEFVYYAPYYLTSVLFMLGTAAWMISELFLRVQLPYWSEVFGWSLVFTNSAALILMNLAGLFQERGVRRSWAGLFSFALLTFLLVPYQAYAALKGLLEPHEGGWHRTQKSGVVTDVIKRMGLGLRMPKLLPKKKKSGFDLGKRLPAVAALSRWVPQPVRTLATKSSRAARLGLALTGAVAILALLVRSVSIVSAAPDSYFLHDADLGPNVSPAGKITNATLGSGAATMVFDTPGQDAYWYSDQTYPAGAGDASLAAGTYTLNMYFASLPGNLTQVSDSFTEAGSTILTSHTPDTGTGWTEVFDSSTATTDATIDAALDIARAGSDENNMGQAYTAAPAPTGTAQIIGFTLTALVTDPGSMPVGVFARRTDNSNFYYLRVLPNPHAEDSLKLFKFVDGVATELATIDASLSTGDTFRLELTDATQKVFHNAVEVLSSTDNALTAVGTWGLYYGNFNGTGGHLRMGWNVADFLAQEPSDIQITVTVYHTRPDGSDPQPIVTSAATTITAATPDPFALTIGTGAAQTFTRSDPRRLTAHVTVNGANAAGSFTLAYESSADPSRLDTPAVTDPEWSLAIPIAVPLIPYLMSFTWKRHRRQLAWRIVGFMLAAGVSISLFATQVEPVMAAPDTFYFHPTATSGITPAGEYMNNTEASGGSTKAFNTASQDAYWYADVTWPTGNDNASIAAGAYTLNMYFVNRPGAGSGDYPSVAKNNTSVNNSNGTSHTVNLPSGIQSGDLLIVIFGFKGGTNQTITWPSGYTSFLRADQVTNVGVEAAYRQADGTEGTTITVQTSANARTSHNSYRITGAADPAVRPPESAASNGNNANPDPASLTPTGGAKDYLWIALEINNNGSTTITGWPTSYSGGIQANGSNQNSTTGSAVRQLNAASDDPDTFTVSSSIAWAAGTLVVHPAASVDIQVTVSHTAADGSGATTIVTSSTTTIDASTADPYALSIGSGSSQSFTSSDPRRLRVQVNVVSVNSGGDFTLDYDGTCASSLCSNLDTPVVTVPEYALILLPIALLIPVAVPLLKNRRTRPTQVGKENSDGQ